MKKIVLLLTIGALMTGSVWAAPTFQAYINGGTAGDLYGEDDTWFSSTNLFNLIVVGSYKNDKVLSLTDVHLVMSVPDGETVNGTVTITGGATYVQSYTTKSFLPATFNDHYPFKDDVSDFILFSLGSFSNLGVIHNYNASDGSITVEGAGEEKIYGITISGFTSAHFDVYGLVTTKNGPNVSQTWDINPGSHDSTDIPCVPPTVPAPAALMLGSMGVGLVGWLRRRNAV